MPTARSAVTVGQVYRDLAPDMKDRDRRLQIISIHENRAKVVVVHDLNGTSGRITWASLSRLRSAAFELVQDPVDEDPLYLRLLAEMPAEYARAALRIIRNQES